MNYLSMAMAYDQSKQSEGLDVALDFHLRLMERGADIQGKVWKSAATSACSRTEKEGMRITSRLRVGCRQGLPEVEPVPKLVKSITIYGRESNLWKVSVTSSQRYLVIKCLGGSITPPRRGGWKLGTAPNLPVRT